MEPVPVRPPPGPRSPFSTTCPTARSPRALLGRIALSAAALLTLALATGCDAKADAKPPSGPVAVGVIVARAEPLTLQTELPGRTAAYRVAEVRARVNGIVLERAFEEGAEVKQGQLLFRIDPMPYQATLSGAHAQLGRARAGADTSRIQVERAEEMLRNGLISQQSYDDIVGAQKAASADVAGGQAAVQAAQINLGYTRVTAPIAGRIGRAEVTEGAYVQQAQATLLATVQQLDPIYVDLTQSNADAVRLRKALESGRLVASGEGAKASLVLDDGSVYSEAGSLQFADAAVDPTTGSISLRAIFPNPKRELLPGMFVRARLDEGTAPDAILVPQVAVRRDAQGNASVFVVGKDETIEVRSVQASRAVGGSWLVDSGLSPGDRVVVEGIQKVRPGAVVTASPAQAPSATSATPPAGSASAAPVP